MNNESKNQLLHEVLLNEITSDLSKLHQLNSIIINKSQEFCKENTAKGGAYVRVLQL
jgi:hypothetical protein